MEHSRSASIASWGCLTCSAADKSSGLCAAKPRGDKSILLPRSLTPRGHLEARPQSGLSTSFHGTKRVKMSVGPSSPSPATIENKFFAVAQILTFLGAVLYGAGWFFLERFYSSFLVAPEEIGHTFSFVVVRVGVLLAAVSGFVVVPTLALMPTARRLVFLRKDTITVSTAVYLVMVAFAVLSAVTVGIVALIAGKQWALHRLPFLSQVLYYILGGLAILAFAVMLLGVLLLADKFEAGSDQQLSKRSLVGLGAVALSALFVGGAIWAASTLANQVASGGQVAFLGFRAESVQAEWLHPNLQPSRQTGDSRDDAECVLFLGNRDGVLVLYSYEEERTIRTSSQNVVLTSRPGC